MPNMFLRGVKMRRYSQMMSITIHCNILRRALCRLPVPVGCGASAAVDGAGADDDSGGGMGGLLLIVNASVAYLIH